MRTRRHHNNKGLRQIKTGKTRKQIDNIRKQLIKEGKMIAINFRPDMIKFGAYLTGHDEDTVAEMLKDYERGTIKSIPVERVVRQKNTEMRIGQFGLQWKDTDNLMVKRYYDNDYWHEWEICGGDMETILSTISIKTKFDYKKNGKSVFSA